MTQLPPLPSTPARPGVTEGARSRPDLDPQTDPRSFPCDQCGADLEYAIGRDALRCSHCGFDRQIEFDLEIKVEEQDYLATLQHLEGLRRNQAEGTADEETIRCTSCSAEVTFAGTVTSTACAYCGQDVQRDRVHTATDRIPVDGLLPFTVDRKEAQVRLSKWLKGLWFAPSRFVRQGLRGRFEGVFLPYFSFDALAFVRYQGQRGDHYTVKVGSGKNARTETRTRWRRVAGKFQRFFDDVLALGLQQIDIPKIKRLEPWPLEQLKPFRAEYLAGFGARTYDRELSEVYGEAKARMDTAIHGEVRQRIGGDEQRVEHVDSRFDAITYKHLLLPLWLMSYRYGDKTYQVILNAVTGEVYGERPWSWVKILFFSLFVLAVIGVLALIFGR